MAASAVSSTVPASESGRSRPPCGGSAIAQEARTIAAEPGALPGGGGRQRLDQPPEAWSMIHLGEMGDLVGDDIVEHCLGGEDETPGKRERPVGRAASPAAPRVAHADPRHAPVDARGERAGPPTQLLAR